MNEPKAIRIQVEYDDGHLERAEGEDAPKIWTALSSALAVAHVHGVPYVGPKLKEVDPDDPATLPRAVAAIGKLKTALSKAVDGLKIFKARVVELEAENESLKCPGVRSYMGDPLSQS